MKKKKSFLSFFSGHKNNKDNEEQQSIKKSSSLISGYSGEESEVNPQKYIHTDEVGSRTREMILSSLNIKDINNDDLEKLITPDEIENVQFSATVPTGLSIDEVEKFCDLVRDSIEKYRERNKELSKDVEKLINETLRVDSKALEQKQQNLLGQQLAGQASKTDSLNEELIKVRKRNSELNSLISKLKEQIATDDPGVNDKLLKENKKLKELIEKTNKQIDSNTAKTNEEVAAQLQALKSEKDSLAKKLDEATADKSKSIEELQKELAETKEQLKSNTEDNSQEALKKELADTKVKLSKALEIRQSAEDVNVTKDSEVKNLKEKLDVANKRIEKLLIGEKQEENKSEDVKALKSTVKTLRQDLIKEKKIKSDEESKINLSTADPTTVAKVISDPEEYERTVMAAFPKKVRKHVKQKLTAEDIRKMQEGESKASLSISGADKNKPTSKESKEKDDINSGNDDKPSSPFDNLMNQMKNDD